MRDCFTNHNIFTIYLVLSILINEPALQYNAANELLRVKRQLVRLSVKFS